MTDEPEDARGELERYRQQVQALRERLGLAMAAFQASLGAPKPDEPAED